MRLAIITVVYNNYANLKDFFTSFERQKGTDDIDFTLYVVDVSSQQREVDVPDFVRVVRAENRGYAAGLNRGLDEALKDGHTKFVFINDDVTVARDFVQAAFQSIDKHPCALIGGKIYYSKGHEYHKDRYTTGELGRVLWYAGGEMDWAHAHGRHRGVDEVDTGQYDAVDKTEFVTGCLMLFDESLIKKAGRMDEGYFLYFEDADWSQQVERAGCALMYDPSVVIWHKNSQSTGGSGSELHRKYQRRNIVRFSMRYAPMRTKVHVVLNYLMGR